MTPRGSCRLDPSGLAATLPIACVLLLGSWLFAPRAAVAGDWVTYTDETATRLVADPSVGANDIEEKDYISGDVDQDGDTDLIVVRKQPFTTAGKRRDVLFMNEDGVLTDRTATLAPDLLVLTNDRDVELVDVDGDLWLDLVTATTFEEQPRILMNLREVGGVWQGFEHDPDRLPFLISDSGCPPDPGCGPFFCGLGVGDVTGDGRPDLYFSDYGGALVGDDDDLDDRLLINDGTGFFTDETEERVSPDMVDSVFGTDADIADMNGDGLLDIVKDTGLGSAGGGGPKVSILYNDPTNIGHFTFEQDADTGAPYMVEPADFTQDGRLDLIVVDDGQDKYLINLGNDAQGHAVFDSNQVNPSPATFGFGGNVKFADLDHDGVLDALVADVDTDIPNCGSSHLVLLQGQGTPPNIHYADPLNGAGRPWNPSTYDVEALHINDDGGLDLVVGACNGTKVFMGFSLEIFGDGFESGDTAAWDQTAQ
ncbi:MAG: FG-GAP repeat domain-containing protein [Thermoanaerobaculia bacterium]